MIISSDTINNEIKNDEKDFIEKCEKSAKVSLLDAAGRINTSATEKPLILISGPSGSGKTTTAIKLRNIISSMGHNVCYISMDKYFKDFTDEERRLKREHKIDLESPDRVDSEFLNSDLKKLLDGQDVRIPSYDFATNTKSYTGKTLNRKDGFVIVEGIHSLNPDLLGENDDFSTRIYISVRSRIVDSEKHKLQPSKIRLMRRMMRDTLYRERHIEDTIRVFPTVQRGENRYILPYKDRSDIDIDTFIPYEASIYKGVLWDELCKLSKQYPDVVDIIQGMNELTAISEKHVPTDALVREFIGGSTLNY